MSEDKKDSEYHQEYEKDKPCTGEKFGSETCLLVVRDITLPRLSVRWQKCRLETRKEKIVNWVMLLRKREKKRKEA